MATLGADGPTDRVTSKNIPTVPILSMSRRSRDVLPNNPGAMCTRPVSATGIGVERGAWTERICGVLMGRDVFEGTAGVWATGGNVVSADRPLGFETCNSRTGSMSVRCQTRSGRVPTFYKGRGRVVSGDDRCVSSTARTNVRRRVTISEQQPE